MFGFERKPSVSTGQEDSKSSEEDRVAMSRRGFLKAAGAGALAMAAPEAMAGLARQEHTKFMTNGFDLSSSEERKVLDLIRQGLLDVAPDASSVEFTLVDTQDAVSTARQGREGEERLVTMQVVVTLKDGTQKRGEASGFAHLGDTTNTQRFQMMAEAFGNAFDLPHQYTAI